MNDDTSDMAPPAALSGWTDEDAADLIPADPSGVLTATRAEQDRFKAVLLNELAKSGANRDEACQACGFSTRELVALEDDDPDFKRRVAGVLEADNLTLADAARSALHRLVASESERTQLTAAMYLDKAYGSNSGKARQVDVAINKEDVFPFDTRDYHTPPATAEPHVQQQVAGAAVVPLIPEFED